MIIGIIPIGGKGMRLGLPFSKEMLPQKGYDYYEPIANHLVKKMELAGAEKIVFIHGIEYKQDVKEFFNDPKYIHITQQAPGFATTIRDGAAAIDNFDKVLFGLPDSIFKGNPYLPMLEVGGIVCGLFTTNDESKVDRVSGNHFDVKAPKTEHNSSHFWGVLKFDKEDVNRFINDNMFEKFAEIGYILNQYPKTMIEAGPYIDLGTWSNYNNYLIDDL